MIGMGSVAKENLRGDTERAINQPDFIRKMNLMIYQMRKRRGVGTDRGEKKKLT